MKVNLNNEYELSSDFEGGFDVDIPPEFVGAAFEMFFKYADPISSVIRETVSNAIDAHKEAEQLPHMTDEQLINRKYPADKLEYFRNKFSLRPKKPVLVRLEKGSVYDDTARFIVQDEGVGISPERMSYVWRNLFVSTKRDNNEEIGGWGLGAKSPLGYCDSFVMVSVWEGVKYYWNVAKANPKPRIDCIHQEETDEPNGVRVEIIMNEASDYSRFQTAIRHQLCYFDGVRYENCGFSPSNNDHKIYAGEHFRFRPNSGLDEMHICLGRVYYPINWQATGMASRDHPIPLGLHFNIGDLKVTRMRESLEYDQYTAMLLADKIELMKEEILDRNLEVTEGIDNIGDFIRLREKATDTSKNRVYISFKDNVSVEVPTYYIDVPPRYPKYDALPKIPGNLLFNWSIRRYINTDGSIRKIEGGVASVIRDRQLLHFGDEPVMILKDRRRNPRTKNEWISATWPHFRKILLIQRYYRWDENMLRDQGLDPLLDEDIKAAEALVEKEAIIADELDDLANELFGDEVIVSEASSLKADEVEIDDWVMESMKSIEVDEDIDEEEEEDDFTAGVDRKSMIRQGEIALNNHFGVYRDKHTGEFDPHLVKLVRQLEEEIDEWVRHRAVVYDDLEIDEKWLQEKRDKELEEKKKLLVAKVGAQKEDKDDLYENSIPVKRYVIDFYGENGYNFGRWRADRLANTFALYNGLVVYGSTEDEDLLMQVGFALFHSDSFYSGQTHLYRSDSAGPPNRALLVLKIGKANFKFMQENFPNAIHISDMMKDRANAIRLQRFATAARIKEKLPARFNQLLNSRMKVIDPPAFKAAERIKAYLNTYYFGVRRISEYDTYAYAKDRKENVLEIPICAYVKENGGYERDALRWYQTVKYFLDDYPLFDALDLEKVDVSAAQGYIRMVDNTGGTLRSRKRIKRIRDLREKRAKKAEMLINLEKSNGKED